MRGLSLGHDAHSRLCHQCQPAFKSHVIENRPHMVRILAPLLHHRRTFSSEDDTRLGVSTRLWSLLQGHSLIVSSLSFIPPSAFTSTSPVFPFSSNFLSTPSASCMPVFQVEISIYQSTVCGHIVLQLDFLRWRTVTAA
jgi:hypothetical protein